MTKTIGKMIKTIQSKGLEKSNWLLSPGLGVLLGACIIVVIKFGIIDYKDTISIIFIPLVLKDNLKFY